MVFFLIAVSFGEDADPSVMCWPVLNAGSSPLQVIYKKFNILCPLNKEHSNVTFDDNHHDVNGTDNFCDAKMVTINSQVRRYYFALLSWLLPRSSVCVGVLTDLWCVLDGVHYPHSGLRFCLPSWGSPHLHWAPRVSPISKYSWYLI